MVSLKTAHFLQLYQGSTCLAKFAFTVNSRFEYEKLGCITEHLPRRSFGKAAPSTPVVSQSMCHNREALRDKGDPEFCRHWSMFMFLRGSHLARRRRAIVNVMQNNATNTCILLGVAEYTLSCKRKIDGIRVVSR